MIGWEEMGLAAAPGPWEQRLIDLRRNLRRLGSGVMAAAAEVWDFIGTPDYDRLVREVPPMVGAPLLAASLIKKSDAAVRAAKVARFWERAQAGDDIARKLMKLVESVPAEHFDDLVDAVDELSKSKTALRKFLESAAKKMGDVEDVSRWRERFRIEGDVTKEVIETAAASVPQADYHRNFVKELLKKASGPEERVKVLMGAVEQGMTQQFYAVMVPRSPRVYRPDKAGAPMEGLDVTRLKRTIANAGIWKYVLPHIPADYRPHVQYWAVSAHTTREKLRKKLARAGLKPLSDDELTSMLKDAMYKGLLDMDARNLIKWE